MAQQRLQTIVTIGGNVDNSFGRLGSALIGLGSQIDMVSQKIIDFGKDSVEKYVRYDDLMREVKALGEYSDAEIRAFDAYNKQIAQSSRHTMEAAASAEGLIAQLGLGIEETKALLPSVLDLSIAAKTDTAQALDYLYYSLNAFDMGLTDAEVLADQMVKTAAIGATEIDTLGQSFQRMGSVLQFFTGGSSEVLAILNGIGQFGEDMQGTKGATQLRNFMLQLIAPIGSKAELLETLELIDMSLEEYEGMLAEEQIDTEKAAEALNTIGFSAYDASGKLKPAIQIIDELGRALSGLGEEERNTFLRNIFGLRTSTMAKNLLSITTEEYKAWQREILYNSDGFTKKMAETMDGGLGGALRKLESAWEAMQTTIGDHLAPAVENAAGFLKDIAIAVANTDPEILDAIVSGLGTIAVAGPALMTAGLAFRMIGYALSTPGAIGLSAIAIIAAARAINELIEADMAAQFGEMELDMESLGSYVQGLGEDFTAAYSETNKYSQALDTAVTSYKDASTAFSSKLMTAALTGAKLTEADIKELQALGQEMHNQVMIGVQSRTLQSMSFWDALLGDDSDEYDTIYDLTNQDYLDTVTRLEGMSQGLRDAMSAAFEDGTVTPEEREKIMTYLREYNAMVAEAQADAAREESQIQLEKMLLKSQTVKLSDIEAYTESLTGQRDKQLGELYDMYLDEKARIKVRYDRAIAEGRTIDGKPATEEGKLKLLAKTDSEYEREKRGIEQQHNRAALIAWESAAKDSELAQAWKALEEQAELYLSGQASQQGTGKAYGAAAGGKRGKTNRYLRDLVDALGGYDAITREMNASLKSNPAWAREMAMLLAMSGIATGETYLGHDHERLDYTYMGYDPLAGKYQAFDEMMAPAMQVKLPDGKGEASGFQKDAQQYLTEHPGIWTVDIKTGGGPAGQVTMDEYALGGRADEPSIFGEAGAEWAIPEEHSQRTAGLLDAARAASGFSWGELIARTGGLNAGGGSYQIVYAPVIHAADARGVEQKLRDDKERFNKWFREREMLEEIEVYH
jgi:TP901 family phage tail tape measure protein